MSILLLSCIRGIRNGKGLLIRAGVCIPNAAPGRGSGAVGQSVGLGQLPFYLSFASVSLPDPSPPSCSTLAQGPVPSCSGFGSQPSASAALTAARRILHVTRFSALTNWLSEHPRLITGTSIPR